MPIVLSDTEDWENSGSEQVFDLLSALGDNAMNSPLKTINEDAVGSQSGKSMLGFGDLITSDGTGTVGGINAGTYTWWKNQFDTTTTTFLTQTSANVFNGISEFNSVMDSIRAQGGKADTIFTTYSIAGAYRTALGSAGYAEMSAQNINGLKGQENPSFMGATIISDDDITAGNAYFSDKRAHQLRVMKNANFKKTPFVSLQSNGQLGQLSYLVAGVQQITANRRRLGIHTAITGI